jgi:hypothetical protein
MTGGGKVNRVLPPACPGGPFVQTGDVLTHSFVLPCMLGQKPPGGTNLLVESTNGKKFKLDTLTAVKCTLESDEGSPENPEAGFNQIRGAGDGTCNGKPAHITFRFTDEGEPNQGRDEATINITQSSAGCNTIGSGTVNGNHQAHPPAGKNA